MEKIDLNRKHKITDAEMYNKLRALQEILIKWVKNNDCSFYVRDRCEITPTNKSIIMKHNRLFGYLKVERVMNNTYWHSVKTTHIVDMSYGLSTLVSSLSLQSKKKINKLFYNINKGELNFFKVRKIVRFFSSYFGWSINRYEKPDSDIDSVLEKGYFKSYSYECKILDLIGKNTTLDISYDLNPKVLEKDSIDWIYKTIGMYY